MTPQDAAAKYISKGWHVVTLEVKGKRCLDSDWLTRTYTPSDFQPHYNIGIKSIHGLVDIDCDCAEAVFMADVFLPKTKAVYGRKSRPRSHHLFRCADITDAVAYKDLSDKKTLIEIRVKHQSMAPPSIHPEGEEVEWDVEDFVEMIVEKVLLVRSVQLCATGALMCKHYNPPGARHDWGVALSGVFRRLGLTQLEAEMLFKAAAKWVSDDKVKDRLDAVRSTYVVSEDTPTTGATRLAELTSKDFVQSIYKIWGGGELGVSKNVLESLNKKHAVVHLQSGGMTIITEEEEDGKHQLRYSTRSDFNMLYPEQVVVGVSAAGKPVVKPLAEAWITDKKRRFYRGIELAPNGQCNPGYYNLWRGYSVEPKQGDWSLFKEHIMLLAEGNEDWYKYILAWMAETVQHPERPVGIALTFKGGQGTGKSTFAKWFGELFGPHFMHLDSEHRLLGQFNSHLHNTILVFADEAVWAGGKQGLGALKRMITETTLAIERKGIDVINVKNMLHMIVASNEDWVVPAGFDNRRFAVFRVLDSRQNQFKFFGAVAEQLFQKGGLAALLYDLLQMQSDVNLRDIPPTDELEQQKKHSMSPRHAWWLEQLMSGVLWQEGETLPPDGEGDQCVQIDPDTLYAAYVTTLRMADHRSNAGYQGAVGRFMRNVLPEPFPQTVQRQGKRFWILPSLAKSRKEFDRVMRVHNKWPVDPEQRLTADVPF